MSTLEIAEAAVVVQTSEPVKTQKTGKKRSFRKPFLNQYPGHLVSQGMLHIKTNTGRKHFLCLLRFAKEVKIIYRAAKHDDPYADARLLEIEDALENAQGFIQEKIRVYEPLIPTSTSLSLSLVNTQTPLELPIHFTTPYAHIAARILVTFDALIRCIVSLYQWGLFAEMPLHQCVKQLSQPIFDLWKTTQRFQSTGLTRVAFSRVGDEATASMKPLDPRILRKERRAKYAPRILLTKHSNNASKTDFFTSTSLT